MFQPSADHKPLEQDEFRGLYDRGLDDQVPDSYFTDCLNNRYSEGNALSRYGLELGFTLAHIVRFVVYQRLNETPRFVCLDNTGNFYDSLYGPAIYSDVSITDFSAVNYNNRLYITPHNRLAGATGKYVIVYEGGGTARLAGGTAPTGFTLGVDNSATSGSIEEGYHLIAVVNVSTSGFVTAPGPGVLGLLNATGGFKAAISNVAVGGSDTAERIILATKAIPVALYDGNQYGYEFFYVPDGTIPNNSGTTITIDFFDSDLVDSADYLIDNLPRIPAGVGIGVFSNRLLVWGENGNEHTVRCSSPAEPEVFSGVSGFFTVDPSAAVSGVRNCATYRKSLIIFKSNRIYSTADNGSEPSTWDIGEPVDQSAGTECFGVNTVLDARGINNDRLFFADRSGCISFEGTVRRPELSWNIQNVWERINKKYFNLVQFVDDPEGHRFFITVPLDAATTLSHILYADYGNAFTVYGTINEKLIKWSVWSLYSAPVSIMGSFDSVSYVPVLHVAVTAGNIYNMKAGLTSDWGNAIDSWIKSSLKFALSGWINHFGAIKLRVTGSGVMTTTLYGEDDSFAAAGPSFTLAASPGAEPIKPINFQNEKLSVKFRVSTFNSNYCFSKIVVFAKELWLMRQQ